MKAFRKVVLLTVVLCLYGFFSCLPAKSFDTDETYTITIIGGHAETSNGETITEAKYGESITIISDLKPGEYVKGWVSDSVLDFCDTYYSGRGYLIFSFGMPACDVTVTAVYEKQTPYTIDLTNGYQMLPDIVSWEGLSTYDYNLIDQWICQSIGDGVDGYYSYNIDLDRDGTEDVLLNGSEGHYYPSLFAAIPLYGCSVKGNIVLDKPNAGPFWPITFKFGNYPIKEEYTVTVIGGRETRFEGDRTIFGKEVFTAKAGSRVYVSADSVDGMYVSEWAFDGADVYSDLYSSSTVSFTMPAKDIIVSAKNSHQIPLTIDFSEGYFVKPGFNIKRLDVNGDATWTKLDIDKDGVYDLCVEEDRIIPIYREEPFIYTFSQQEEYMMYSSITVQIDKLEKEYFVTVNGGHAEDAKGNVITRAASGTTVRIIRDKESGKYWKSWKSDYLDSEFVCFEFIMPARDVTFTAETTSQQIVYDLDLTEDLISLSDEDIALLSNAIRIFYNQIYFSVYSADEADFNRDGLIDFDMYAGNTGIYGLYVHRASTYSLGTSYTVKFDEGQIGTLNIFVNNEVANNPIVDKSVGKFKITIEGDILCMSDTVTYDSTIIEVYPGEHLWIIALKSASDNEYCTGCVCEGVLPRWIRYKEDYSFDCFDFYMPYRDISFTGHNSKQIPIEFDLCSGFCIVNIEDFEDYYFPSLLEDLSGVKGNTYDSVEFSFDLNQDGMEDLLYNAEEFKLSVSPNPYTVSRARIELNNFSFRSALKYSPLVLILSKEKYYHIDYQVRTEDGISLYDDFSCMTWVDNGYEMMNVFDATEGTIVHFTFDKEKKGYELVEYYYIDEKGKKQSFDGYLIEDNETSFTVVDYIMPAGNISTVGIYRKMDSESPTPTIVPTENVTPSLSPTEAPADKDKPSSATDSDDFHPFALLIAGLVLCMIGVGFYAALYLRRMKDKSDTPE